MVGNPERPAPAEKLCSMSNTRIILVHLRQPRRSDPNENRADPFYEFGSFGCTKCHSKNLMNPHKAHELRGCRFAFAQGGPLGFRLVHLTPPARVVEHKDRCELVWTPAHLPFRYDTAPLLVNAQGESDFPALRAMIRGVSRPTWPSRLSSKFRSRRTPLPTTVAAEVARVFDRKRAIATPESIAKSYVEALPYPPNKPDGDRRSSLDWFRAMANGSDPNKPGRPCRMQSCAKLASPKCK